MPKRLKDKALDDGKDKKMTRECLLEKYEKYGDEWQIKFIKRELKTIDNIQSKQRAFNNINWWVEHCDNQIGNLSLSDNKIDEYETKMSMYNDLLYLDEFKEMQ